MSLVGSGDVYKRQITWCKIDIETYKRWINQCENYKSNLVNKNVLETIDLLLKTLKEHYRLK